MAKAMFATFISCLMTVGAFASDHGGHQDAHHETHEPAHHEAQAEAKHEHDEHAAKPAGHGDHEEPAAKHEHDEHASKPAHDDHAAVKHGPKKDGFLKKFLETWVLGQFINDFHKKIEHAAKVDQENESLRKRLSEIEVRFSHVEHEAAQCREHARADRIKHDAVEEGGHEASRTLASLKTFDEKLLSRPPKAIYEEALKSFAKDDFETAAKALAFLSDNEENDAFQTVQVYYLTGVSLYKVGNFKRAITYLERAKSHAEGDELSYVPRTLGWIALCQKKLGNRAGEKQAIKELIEKYPKSKEARRLNGNA